MKRTTILADDDLALEMQYLAARRGVTFTALVQEAMRAYVVAQRSVNPFPFAGIAASATPVDYSDGRDEEIIAQTIDPIYGLGAASADETGV